MKILRDDGFPANAVLVIGSGHFGARAARLLATTLNLPTWVVDSDEKRLEQLEWNGVNGLLGEGVDFMARHFDRFHPSNLVVPAVPLHLALEWLRAYGSSTFLLRNTEIPAGVKPFLPFAWNGRDGDLLVSHADFRCPDDCPEPDGACAVTGRRREMPLHRRLGIIQVAGYHVHIVESRQLAPGLGGYRVEDLRRLYDRVRMGGKGRWLIGTACKCHGVLTAVDVEPRGEI